MDLIMIVLAAVLIDMSIKAHDVRLRWLFSVVALILMGSVLVRVWKKG